MPSSPESNPSSSPPFVIAEVRYSLPAMLQQLKAERATGTFGMEKLDQSEIGKLFKAKLPRRAKSSK